MGRHKSLRLLLKRVFVNLFPSTQTGSSLLANSEFTGGFYSPSIRQIMLWNWILVTQRLPLPEYVSRLPQSLY